MNFLRLQKAQFEINPRGKIEFSGSKDEQKGIPKTHAAIYLS